MAAAAAGFATQWYLLLVTVLGILSDCRSSRDLEAFAKRHREALNQALGLHFKRWPTDATFLYLFNKAHLEQFGEVLQTWMISQIPGGATALEQLVRDGKTLKGSAIETTDGGGPAYLAMTDDYRLSAFPVGSKNRNAATSNTKAPTDYESRGDQAKPYQSWL